MRPTAIVQASAKADVQKPKSGSMEEWAQYPLQDWTGIENWMSGVSDQFTITSHPIEPFGESWGRMDQFMTFQNNSKARSPANGESQGASAYNGQPPGGSAEHTDLGAHGHQAGKEQSAAEELSKSKSSIYF